MTAQQYIAAQFYNLLMTNNPGLDPQMTQTYAATIAALYTNLILPNLSVNLTTGAITFVVPSS
jgi:hypothetical protein